MVGVWRDQNRLVQQNGDLTGRVVAIDADQWTEDELREVIEFGESLPNVTFSEDFNNDLLEGCFQNVFVVQESCRFACERASVFGTQSNTKVIDANAPQLIKVAVDAYSSRYMGFILNFALGFQTSTLEIFKWLLWPVLNAEVGDLEKGLKYGDLRSAIDARHPNAPINAGNITQALQSVASLQVGKLAIKPIILDYDESNRRLSVVDRSFLIWLQHQNRSDILLLAELPGEDSE